ncbi:immunity 52 family protein [Archangium lipolyticum]|uniref:immunity 52 family protein n=1 Tax=Archangium lipolyticum TaxID=2970465 RepID=UPI00214A253F|nr:immunity 52 family protein [Archangium lipolyticum]
MSEAYSAGAYWGSRPELAEDCARRAATFFRLMAECHPSYAHWFEQNNSTRKALQLGFEPTHETFLRFFGKKKYQAGPDGFSFGAWTGHVGQEQGGMVLLNCGGDAEVAPNRVRLFFPSEPLGSERMIRAPVLAGVMRAMALAWEPEWALATADGLWDQLSGGSRIGCFLGWMTYFSHARGQVPALPAPVRVEPVEDKGTLVILTPERLTPSNPEHVALARRVQELLAETGLFRPVVQPPTVPQV